MRRKRPIQLKRSVIENKMKPSRQEKLKVLNLENIQKQLEKRRLAKSVKVEKKRNLVSVHKGLENTKSKEYVANRKSKRTSAELLVEEYLLRANRKFVVEMPIKNDYSLYIIDFYIPKYKLCIEVDGGYHNNPIQKWRDDKKDEFLISKGYKVLRFDNEDLLYCSFQQFFDTLRRYEVFGK